MTNKRFLPFEDARDFACALKLKNQTEWRNYCISGQRPSSIPTDPRSVYKVEWQGWGDWLGTGRKRGNRQGFLPFEEARAIVRGLGIKNMPEWRIYCKSGQKPANIPVCPEDMYRAEWQGYGDWLGTGAVATKDREYLPFKEARTVAQALNFKNMAEWQNYCASGQKPENIPATPQTVYKTEWQGSGDWLGTGTVAPKDREFLPFEEAQAYVQSLTFKNTRERYAYSSSGQRPANIPAHPDITYKGEWKGFDDWLGTESNRTTGRKRTGSNRKRQRAFLPFEEARACVQSLNVKNTKEWYVYSASEQRPLNIPSSPWSTYKAEWQGFGDWLGTESKRKLQHAFLPFEEARTLVRDLGLKNQKEWEKYRASEQRPENIPSDPRRVYQTEWKGVGDWLGTGRIAYPRGCFLPFEEARAFVWDLGLKTASEWRAYCKSQFKPGNIPSEPLQVYQAQWHGFGDWLGTGRTAYSKGCFLPFEEARAFVRELGLKNLTEWRAYIASEQRPTNIPSTPDRVYQAKWQGFGDWLGTNHTRKLQHGHLPFEEARAFVRGLELKNAREWRHYCKSGQRPANIPASPYQAYKDTWQGMSDWLGNGKEQNFQQGYLSSEIDLDTLVDQIADRIMQKLAQKDQTRERTA